ncbi:Sugar phosphate permease [Parafrankia irregularis]|uniref:Sugar phosphate permease n=1 Tax=Parafrankia irregularis TaxID=795642 RepID=A0A0S4R0N5_9ACTN|nr:MULTISPECIES: MFS transporter [Parafrankia]MBE3203543.1 MFS transporter [Parafrankia sp. CH37]CUU60438.1 Sugar phosphate permease [Parafrankia irregularis]
MRSETANSEAESGEAECSEARSGTAAGETSEATTDPAREPSGRLWLTPGVGGIGTASFLADVGHEVPTALMAGFVTVTLGAPAAALGAIEGISDGLAGAGRFVGGALADDPRRRRTVAIGGYTTTAALAALIGATTSTAQAGVLRGAAWAARGLRVPARNALLADVVPAAAYGRAYGFERTMDNLGAIVGPLLALGLVSLVGVRTAMLLSVIPGLLAAVAVGYAIRQAKVPRAGERRRLRFQVRPVLRGQLGRVLTGFTAFEVGNAAAALLILRATDLLAPGHGTGTATQIAIGLYIAYNIAATAASFPAGGISDRLGRRGPLLVTVAGVAAFLASYLLFAAAGPQVWLLGVGFVLAGFGIGCAETAEHAAVAAFAPEEIRGSAFGLLATVQAVGNTAASVVAGLLYTVASPALAFGYLTAWMALALVALLWATRTTPA